MKVETERLTKSIAAEDKTPHKSSLALWEPGLGGANRSGVDKGEGEAVSCQTEDGEKEPVLDGEEGQHEAHTRTQGVSQSPAGQGLTRDLLTAEPINIDHLQPIIRHSWPTMGIDIPWRTTLVVVRNTKPS